MYNWKWNFFTNAPDFYSEGTTVIPETVPDIIHVDNYSALPDPATVSLYTIYVVDNAQGNKFWYGSIGGTYYPAGAYYSALTKWVYSEAASKATQAEVNTGTDNEKYLTAETFNNANKWYGYQNKSNTFIFVYTKSDLPNPVGGVITLANSATYYFTATVDLTGDRIVAGQNTVILGASSENCYLKSTGLSGSTALITSIYSLPIRNISFTHGTVFNLDGDGITTALDWFGINFVDCATVGTIKDYSNFVMTDSAFLNASGLTFDGTFGTIAFGNCLFDTSTGGTAITIPSTLTISRRFRIIYSSFITLSGETSINFSSSAIVGNERYILDTVNFGGGGTYISGVDQTSNKTLFVNCVGIINTAVNGQLYMQNNSTVTTISGSGIFAKVLGTTTASSDNSKYLHSDNRLTNDATISRKYLIQCILSFTSGASHVCEFGFYDSKLGGIRTPSRTKSTSNGGGRAENVSFSCVVSHVQGDYLEIWCANNTSSQNITVTDMNFVITEIK